MNQLESTYQRIFEEKLTFLKEDFNKEKSEWRSMSLLTEYKNNALDRLQSFSNYPADVNEIIFKAEILFQKRKSLPDFISAVLSLIDLKEEDQKIIIVEAIAEIKANREFINYLDNYIANNEKRSENNSKSIKLRIPKIRRDSNDGITNLSQIQTSIFFQYLREIKIVLSEEYLTNSDLSDLIFIGTGYSAEKIRQRLSMNNKDFKKEDLKEIFKILDNINKLIKRDLDNNQ